MLGLIEYRITVGTQEDKTGAFLDPNKRRNGIRKVVEFAASEFGGYTLVESRGGWIDPTGELVTESGIVLTICVSESIALDVVAEFGRACGRFLHQHSVVLASGGRAAVIEC